MCGKESYSKEVTLFIFALPAGGNSPQPSVTRIPVIPAPSSCLSGSSESWLGSKTPKCADQEPPFVSNGVGQNQSLQPGTMICPNHSSWCWADKCWYSEIFSDWGLDSNALSPQHLALSDPSTSASLPGYLLHWHPRTLSTVYDLAVKVIDMSICQQLIISISWDRELFSPLWGRPCSDIYPPALCWQLAVGKRFHIISLK